MDNYILECCVDSVESAINAKDGGANRLELCSNLIIGGTTPTYSLFNRVKKYTDIKTNVLIRPRFGDFCYTNHEFEIISEDIKMFKELGADGIVIGFLKPNGDIDVDKVKKVIDMAKGMHITFHRAFDVCKNPFHALCQLSDMGIHTILTSGQKNNCIDGLPLIKELVKERKNIEILIGSGINLDTVKIFVDEIGVLPFHLSGKKEIDSKMAYRNDNVSMGLPLLSEYIIWETDRNKISEIKNYLELC